MSTLNVDTINDRTGSGGPDFNNGIILGSSTLAAPLGSAPSYTCRAWVSFDGTGTVAIDASGNVTSITDQGTGDYRVNFTTSMPNANYAAVIFNWLGSGTGSLHYTSNLGKNVAYVDFETRNASAVSTDLSQCNVAIFR